MVAGRPGTKVVGAGAERPGPGREGRRRGRSWSCLLAILLPIQAPASLAPAIDGHRRVARWWAAAL